VPENAEAYYQRGLTFESKGAVDNALEDYGQALELAPERVDISIRIGMAYERKGEEDLAVEHYQGLLSSHPENAAAMNNLAWLYAEKGEKLKEAEQLAEKAAQSNPKEAGYLDTLGWIQYKQEKYTGAEENLKNALTLLPGEPTIHYHLALVYLKQGDKDRGKTYLNKALETGSEFAGIEEARKVLAELQ
jgi:Tfp pilus assembly protein PilF